MVYLASGRLDGSPGAVMVGPSRLVPSADLSREPRCSILPLVTGIQDGVTGNPTAEEFVATDFLRTGPAITRGIKDGTSLQGAELPDSDMPATASAGMYQQHVPALFPGTQVLMPSYVDPCGQEAFLLFMMPGTPSTSTISSQLDKSFISI